jgi:deoxyribose-phosphate aldolase
MLLYKCSICQRKNRQEIAHHMPTPPISLPASIATLSYEQIAKTIDHSLLRPELTDAEMIAGCELAHEYHVASVCIKPSSVPLAAGILESSDVLVGTVVGFPHGSSTTRVKVLEARQALEDGAAELDMVINIGWLRSGEDQRVEEDIRAVVNEAKGKALVKVILENAYLTDDEKVRSCHLVEAAGADFVKTSTGFAPSGATLDDLRLMRASVAPHIQVKAAGGVRTLDALLDVINTGTTRVGATATATILDDFRQRKAAL